MAEEIESKPEAQTPEAKPAQGMTSGRRFAIGLNVVVQVLVIAIIVGMINFISFRRFVRWDFTRDQKFALSTQTKNLLGSLTKPVQAIVYFSGGGAAAQIGPDVMTLLKEYEYTSKRKLSVETVDPYRNLGRAKELSEKYKFGGEENVVILDYDGRSKFVNAIDMAEMDQMNPMMPVAPQVRAFKGESALTSALLELVEGKPQKLYIVTGHGEPEVKTGDRPENPEDAMVIGEYFKRSNIKFENLKLLDVERVPEDATALMIFGPRQDFSEREIEIIHNYWQDKGRIFIALSGSKTPRLSAWLGQWGVTPGAGRLLRLYTTVSLTTGERKTQIMASAEGTFDEMGAAITRDLAGTNAFFFGATAPLELDRTKAAADQLQFTELASVGKDYWHELDGSVGPAIPSRDPAREKEGPFTTAVAVEKGAMQGVKVDTARMIVVGNSAFLTDGGLQQFDLGLEFGLNSVNWLLNREQGAGVGIPPKEKKLVSLALDETKLRNLAYAVVLGIPGVVAIFGLLSWFQRRR